MPRRREADDELRAQLIRIQARVRFGVTETNAQVSEILADAEKLLLELLRRAAL